VKKILGTTLLALVLSAVGSSQTRSAADLLSDIDAQGSLWSTNRPFLLEADFVAQVHKPETGHFTWKWSAKDLWREETTLADFHQVAVRKADETFTARNLAYAPLPLREIHEVFNAPHIGADKWDVAKAKLKIHGNQECIELHNPTHSDWRREICVSADTMQVASDETITPAEVRRREFSDYQPFLNSSIPRTLKLTIDGVAVLTVVVTLLEERSFTANEFVAPANATVRRTCANMTWPKAIKTPSPIYPPSEKVMHVNGTSIVSVTVLPDGSVSEVYLVGSSYHDMDAITQQIVKTWKFKPAMCGTEPVTADIQVQVNFRTR
jgi:TonB family protein